MLKNDKRNFFFYRFRSANVTTMMKSIYYTLTSSKPLTYLYYMAISVCTVFLFQRI